MREEGNIAGRQAAAPRLNDGLILLDSSLAEAGKLLAHYSTSGARALLESARPAASRFNLQLKWSFAVLIFAVVIDTKQIYSVGRGRSL